MTNKKLCMISLDAFGQADLEYALTLPNFKMLYDKSAKVDGVESVYPSLTYMAHTSIATGHYPAAHGVVNNTKIQPERYSPDWFWYERDIQQPTLFQVAHQAKLSVATLLWPVTGMSRAIRYNIAEIFPNRKWQSQFYVSLRASSAAYLLAMHRKFGHLLNGIQQPALDDFVTAVAVDTILSKQPDVLAVHLVDLDSTRHATGVHSAASRQAIERMDRRLGEIVAALQKAGTYDQTVLAVFGDHYQMDTHTVVRPNHLFWREDWLAADMAHNILPNWRVYAKGADGACYIYRKDDSVTVAQIIEALAPLAEAIERIYTQEEAAELGADPNCVCIIEAKEGYYFESDVLHPFSELTNQEGSDHKLSRATHGYHPLRDNYLTTFFMSGPGIDATARVPRARLVDEGPTLLHAIGLQFPTETAGRVLVELFEK